MKVTIKENVSNEETIIHCQNLTKNISQAILLLEEENSQIIGFNREKIHHVLAKNILYFEAVDNKVFFHTIDMTFEIKKKLYEVEEELKQLGFLRISKAFIINLNKIEHLSPAFNGRLEAVLTNKEIVIISRQYVKTLKKILQL